MFVRRKSRRRRGRCRYKIRKDDLHVAHDNEDRGVRLGVRMLYGTGRARVVIGGCRRLIVVIMTMLISELNTARLAMPRPIKMHMLAAETHCHRDGIRHGAQQERQRQ